ncbi:MAG: PhzF family phenazine biosynthesis protein [Propionibacteriales bacterium]|nr:PhzF family phenazine biosynthesis protein [Propionibacteriales bacterium]
MSPSVGPGGLSAAAESEWLRYDVVDVFTDRVFAGNPLAVVYGADELSSEQMHAIATEFNLSETTFPLALTADDVAAGADYRLRIFTPGGEVPFAGHPTLGTAWALTRRGLLAAGSRVQSCAAGLVGVEVPAEARDAVELSAAPRDAASALTLDEVDAVARLVGLAGTDVVGPAHTAGCGLTWLFLPVAAESVLAARPTGVRVSEVDLDTSLLRDPLDGVCVYAVASGAEDPPGSGRTDPSHKAAVTVTARVFVPGYGIPEDPATGSAAAGLGVVLVAAGLARADGQTAYRISQGVEMGRPSVLWGRVDAVDGVATRCHVAGQVVHAATGTIAVP